MALKETRSNQEPLAGAGRLYIALAADQCFYLPSWKMTDGYLKHHESLHGGGKYHETQGPTVPLRRISRLVEAIGAQIHSEFAFKYAFCIGLSRRNNEGRKRQF